MSRLAMDARREGGAACVLRQGRFGGVVPYSCRKGDFSEVFKLDLTQLGVDVPISVGLNYELNLVAGNPLAKL